MKRWFCAALCGMALALLCACRSDDVTVAVDTQTAVESFPIAEAETLVRPWDAAAAWLSAQDEITRSEADAVVLYVDASFPGEGENMLGMFIDMAQYEDEAVDAFPVASDTFCPTDFHEGVEVTSAEKTVATSVYESGTTLETARLEVTETYTGSDEALADWHRTYIFEETDDGWEFMAFDGIGNFGGENWDPDYLPLGKSADEIYTPYT